MYREIITPIQSDFIIHLPKEMIGKKVEVIAFNIDDLDLPNVNNKPTLEMIEEFYSKYNVDMSEFMFNRDDANER